MQAAQGREPNSCGFHTGVGLQYILLFIVNCRFHCVGSLVTFAGYFPPFMACLVFRSQCCDYGT